MNRLNVELAVGIFMIAGFLCFAYISIKLGDVKLFEEDTYTLQARFGSISGLKKGADIEIAGVKVGKVTDIALDGSQYEALVKLSLSSRYKLQQDSIASVRTAGVIGDKFISIAPGGSEEYLRAGDSIRDTESSVSLEELISKYIFEKE
ncbi:MAG: putative ABC transport system substrate-binding protein [Gammaproteobacteria bacterium]|nr:MAG: putative ABC transport system substrate-binding protein [Gammaproteobacteria bacterium]TND06817.1 MAG: putative ABC transport system substrate-binding protein [Gammaproteobacteria bacterium]